MSDVRTARKAFIEALMSIVEADISNEKLTADLRAAFLDFGSGTPDNLKCASRIEIGPLGDETGMKIRGRGLLLADIAYGVEDLPMPDGLKASFPDLTADDWDAFTRLTTLIYVCFGRRRASQT